MDWSTTIGCFLLIFAPYIIAFSIIWTRSPQLMPVVLSGSCAAILSLFIIAVLFEGLRTVFRFASWTPALAVVVIPTQVVVQFLLKVVVLWGWVAIQDRLRTENQGLISCECRFAPVPGAVGLGFAMTSTWATGGALFDAFWRLPHFSAHAAAYELDVCPQLPLLVHSSLQCAMLTVCQVAWGIMTGQPAVALARHGLGSYLSGLRRRLLPFYAPTSRVTIIDVVSGADRAQQDAALSEEKREGRGLSLGTKADIAAKDARAKSPPAINPQLLAREEVEGALLQDHEKSQKGELRMRTSEDARSCPLTVGPTKSEGASVATAPDTVAAVNPFESPLYRYNGTIPVDTIFSLHLDFGLLSLLSALILQLIFSMVTIAHSGALNMATGVEVATRGCVVSLPIQLVVLMVSVVWALWTLREERLNID